MTTLKSPYIRVLLLAVGIALVAWMPTREFLKITFMLGIPFVFVLGFMGRKERYSLPWIISLVLLLTTMAGYVFLLIGLPDRIETRRIISEGGALVAEGKYDQAINQYHQLAGLGRSEQMKEKIHLAEQERAGARLLQEARDLLKVGKREQAKKMLGTIPAGTRAARQANELHQSLDE